MELLSDQYNFGFTWWFNGVADEDDGCAVVYDGDCMAKTYEVVYTTFYTKQPVCFSDKKESIY